MKISKALTTMLISFFCVSLLTMAYYSSRSIDVLYSSQQDASSSEEQEAKRILGNLVEEELHPADLPQGGLTAQSIVVAPSFPLHINLRPQVFIKSTTKPPSLLS